MGLLFCRKAAGPLRMIHRDRTFAAQSNSPMFQQIEEQQKAVQEKLAGHILETSSGEGLVTVRMAGNKEVRSIIIDREHPGYADADQVEDHLVLALNDAIRQASTLEQELVQEWMSSVLPGGLGALGGLGSLFGK